MHRPLLPEPIDVSAIMAEHAASEQRVLDESLPYAVAVQAFRGANRCDRCGKTRALLNIAKMRGFHSPWKSEAISADIHCACEGGPAYVAPPTDAEGIAIAPAVHVETIDRLFSSVNGGWIEPSTHGVVLSIDTHRKIATLLFEGHAKPYLLNIRDLRGRVRAVA